jgi:hypothetical protein
MMQDQYDPNPQDEGDLSMTPGSQTDDVTNAIILERVENLREDVSKLNELMRCYQENMTRFELDSSKERAVLKVGAEDTKKRLDGHDRQMETLTGQIKDLRDSVAPLLYTNKLLTFLGSALMVSILTLIWSIITHRVTLMFP